MTQKTILEVRDLNKAFGAVVAAADINIEVTEGEIIAIIGANGAGKTTFVNMVTGYLTPTTGTIRFLGQDITGRAPAAVCKAGLTRSFQVAQLFPGLTVMENMLVAFASLRIGTASFFTPLNNAAARKTALGVLSTFGIDPHADAPVSALAQGVRKLLDISMAMISGPSLLMLDEPTSGVAVDEKFPLMETVMAGVRQTDATIMFIEHDMEIVTRYASRVIAFYEGTIIADGPVAQVLDDERVRKYIVGQIQAAATADSP
ncbi:ABC transporter ATP-binding protein [Castellaniella sp.]|uniref:ABC transporter ATP-binding protein n=1 Tax=Castellaniella sp. TaxID=1955812 RepID=UPI00355D9F1A